MTWKIFVDLLFNNYNIEGLSVNEKYTERNLVPTTEGNIMP